MKHWQERIPTFNLILINSILVILILAAFIVGPTNKMAKEKNDVLTVLKQKFNVDNCSRLETYTFEKDMFMAQCKVNELDYYLFLDKNGIVHKRSLVDTNKEQQDYSMIIEKYNIKNAKYSIVYVKDQLAYWIKSKEFEYIINYENLDVIMKVRF